MPATSKPGMEEGLWVAISAQRSSPAQRAVVWTERRCCVGARIGVGQEERVSVWELGSWRREGVCNGMVVEGSDIL